MVQEGEILPATTQILCFGAQSSVKVLAGGFGVAMAHQLLDGHHVGALKGKANGRVTRYPGLGVFACSRIEQNYMSLGRGFKTRPVRDPRSDRRERDGEGHRSRDTPVS